MFFEPCLKCGKLWPTCGCSASNQPDPPQSQIDTALALARFMDKAKPKPKRRNSRPEKQVEFDCMSWMRRMGWSVQVYEARQSSGRYTGVLAGTVDCQGVLPNGTFVAVEFKAPGKLKTFNRPANHRQRNYLIEKINHFAFGCVVDSLEKLQEIYAGYKMLTREDALIYLLEQLPSAKPRGQP